MKYKILYTITRLMEPVFSEIKIQANRQRVSGFRMIMFHNIQNKEYFRFEEIIEFINKNYEITSPCDLVNPVPVENGSKKTRVIMSFDDGFLSQSRVAKELLEPRGIKAVFFISPNFIELSGHQMSEFIFKNLHISDVNNRGGVDGFRPMAWDDVRRLVDKGHTIGAHTMDHVSLSSIMDEGDLKREIGGSGDILEDKLGVPIEWFSYPFGVNGGITRDAYKIILERYRYCCTGLRGENVPGNDLYYLRRDSINTSMPLHYVKFVLDGGIDFRDHFRMGHLKKITGVY